MCKLIGALAKHAVLGIFIFIIVVVVVVVVVGRERRTRIHSQIWLLIKP